MPTQSLSYVLGPSISKSLRVCSCKMCKHMMDGAGSGLAVVLLLLYRILFFYCVFQPHLSCKILTSSLLLLALINTKFNIYLVS